MKKQNYNFSPGPSMLPVDVMQQVRAEFLNYKGTEISIAEVSHRGSVFSEIVDQLHTNMRKVLKIPDDFEIIFCAGGGQGQFSCVPMNLLGSYNTAAYLVSGHWSRKALNEAKRYTNPVCVADAKNTDYRSIPDQSSWELPRSAAYLYCCDNETVHGLMLTRAPKLNLPVVCDMTSSLMTAPVDWGCYDLVFAGCQKNIAPAGMTVIVIRKDLLKRTPIKETPSIFNYEELIKNRSLLNTPATFSWYVASLVCQWVINQGGLEEMQRRCNLRSSLLYAYIDQSALYVNQVEKPFRSNINVCFNLRDERLMPEFLVGAEKEGLLSLKGHKAVGGLRASLYNAMPVAGVESLVAYMKNFESNYRCDK